MNKIFSHRGLSKIYPENSLGAIMEATKYEYIYGVEIDVRMTKDKKFVIIHDPDITLVSNGTGLVCDMTLEQLHKYNFTYNTFNIKKEYFKSLILKGGKEKRKKIKNLKEKKSKIITLETILSSVKNKHLLIEVKQGKDECFDLEKFYNIIKKYNCSNISIQSFNKEVVDWLKNKDKNLNVGILIGKSNIKEKLNMNTNFISIEQFSLTKKILEKQIKLNRSIYVWTVNNHKEIKKLKKKLGDLFDKINIITDNPEIIQKYLK